MDKIVYYNPEIPEEITSRLMEIVAGVDDTLLENKSFSTLGRYVLSSLFYTVPDQAKKLLGRIEGFKERISNEEVCSLSGAQEEGCETGMKAYFSIAAELHEVNTFHFLLNSCVVLLNGEAPEAPAFMRLGIANLLNRFERTGKLFVCYDSDFKAATDDFSFIYNYLLLPVCLLKMFEQEGDLQVFSTALKAVDVIPHLLNKIDDVDTACCALAAIYLRDYHLRKFYADREFRMPSNG